VLNPYDAPRTVTEPVGVFADGATRITGTLLYRVIDFRDPFVGLLVYDGWWFWQRVTMNGQRVWSKISWLRIEPVVEFTLPESIDATRRVCRIEIQFGPGLMIRRFQVTVAGMIAYDEFV